MSYEGKMLRDLSMPNREDVEYALLAALFWNNGSIKEFAKGESIVEKIADDLSLNQIQREAILERIYEKESRVVKTPLWHRLLYRATDSLANKNLITRPTVTFLINNKKEWMLTEKGYDTALDLLNIPKSKKDDLAVSSIEVEKFINRIKVSTAPIQYSPLKETQEKKIISLEKSIRIRGFRKVVTESYDFRCSVCGLKINSPNGLYWEVDAAHIVPHSRNGKDDIWNGIALCKFHHWAFDVGWFSITDDFKILASTKFYTQIESFIGNQTNSLYSSLVIENKPILLPKESNFYPHTNSLQWH